ncbi:MAG: amidohydrolase family protein, partial [Pseudomonadota bacterium]
MARTLIKNATIVTMDRTLGTRPGCDLLIEGDQIAEIRPGIAADDGAEVIDATQMIVMPGLINAHVHAWETVLRGTGADWPGDEYFEVVLGKLAAHMTPDDIYLSTLLGALSQIDSGCTTMFEWLHASNTPDHSDMCIKALEEAGIRASFGHGTPKPEPRACTPHFSDIPHPAAEIDRLCKGRFASNDGMVRLVMCILGPDYAGIELNRKDFALAREYGLQTCAHVWGGAGRKVPGGYRTIIEEGLLDPGHMAVHANFFEADEVQLLVDHGASLIATPVAELGVPRSPMISKVIRAGGRPCVAVDSEIDVSGSMFDAMRAARQLQMAFDAMEAYDPDAARQEKGRPDIDVAVTAHDVSCSSFEVLEWATINAAHAMGIAEKTGSLVPGKQ